ncbi:MAG: hypothetical protein QM639_05845 [Rhodocyclaceae bacterium]
MTSESTSPPPARRWPACVWLGLILAITVLVLCLIVRYSGHSPDASRLAFTPPPAAKASPHELTGVVDVTTRELLTAYGPDGTPLDERLRGKYVRVTGVVRSIELDFAGDTLLALDTPNRLMPAHMHLVPHPPGAARSPRRGQTVVLICARMERILGQPYGDGCRLLP